jgi:hypothetical protein
MNFMSRAPDPRLPRCARLSLHTHAGFVPRRRGYSGCRARFSLHGFGKLSNVSLKLAAKPPRSSLGAL